MVENSLLPQKLPSPYDDPDGADDVGCFVAVRDVDCVSSDLEGRDFDGCQWLVTAVQHWD